MHKNLIWKIALIVGLIALSLLVTFPPGQHFRPQLKPGLDLVGGTTLIYEVEVPSGANVAQTVEQTIEIMRKRVDEKGLLGLVWRRVGGNRIEIQMPAGSRRTVELRDIYLKERADLLRGNLDREDLDSALEIGDRAARARALDQLAGGNAERRAIFEQLAEAYDAQERARAEQDRAETAAEEAQAALDVLVKSAATRPDAATQPGDAARTTTRPVSPEEQAARARLDQVRKDLREKARARIKAESDFDALLAGTAKPTGQPPTATGPAASHRLSLAPIEDADLDRLFSFPSVAPAGKTSPREAALADLIKAHPDRADALRRVADAYAQYETVKGPLDDPNDLIAMLHGQGVLEFRIAAHPTKVMALDDYYAALEDKGPAANTDKPWRWFRVDDLTSFAETEAEQKMAQERPREYFANSHGSLAAGKYRDAVYLLLGNTSPDKAMTHEGEQAWSVKSVGYSQDRRGFPAVDFSLDNVGSQLMGIMSGQNLQEPMAIVLDGKVVSAPSINDRLGAGSIQVTFGSRGNVNKEVEYLVKTLNAGSSQGKLSERPLSIIKTGSQFGEDNLRAGLRATMWSMIIVSAFMLVYYFFWGAVADFAMVMNLVLVVGVMALFKAAWTLPGIAGVVLTVGMAVDVNVLVYERIREELERNVPLRTAVRLGFQKAFATIIDAHVTALITCVVLFYTATADLKGFAITLGVGLLANLFTGTFVTHVIIDLFLDLVHPTSLKMLPMVSKTVHRLLSPHIDWIGKRFVFIGISVVLSIAGLAAVVARGPDFLDIEFRSGTEVAFELAVKRDAQGRPVTDAAGQPVRQVLDVTKLKDLLANAAKTSPAAAELAHAQPVPVGDPASGAGADAKYSRWSVQTIIQDPNVVTAAIQEAFKEHLDFEPKIDFLSVAGKPASQAIEEGKRPAEVKPPVYAIKKERLGSNLPGLESLNKRVSNRVGGIAIVLSGLNPARSIDEVKQRIDRTRLQAQYEGKGLQSYRIVPVASSAVGDAAPASAGAATAPAGSDATLRYTAMVIIDKRSDVDYKANDAGFTDENGYAQVSAALVRDALQRDTTLGSVSSFSSTMSASMQAAAVRAIFFSCLAIMVYIWIRFGNFRYGVAAIIATLHDVVIAMGLLALSSVLYKYAFGEHKVLGIEPFRLNLTQIAALLTLIGYSLNDTVVVFDRIRENRGRLAFATPQIINDSINQTISRTILTSTTVFIAVLILYVIGGEGVHGFAFTMLVGVVVGTYSSIAIASPLLLIGLKDQPRPGPTAVTRTKAATA